MSDITLSSAVRKNLLSLQNTATMMSKTQERLATGKKVNSALDNPTNFFTAAALSSRANDFSRLLDSVSNAVQTLEAADNGIKAITRLVESAQATARQALQTAKGDITTAASTGTDINLNTSNGVSSTDSGVTGSFDIVTVTGGLTTTIVTDGKSLDELATEISLITNVTATVTEDPANDGEFRLNITGSSETFTIANNAGTAAVDLGINLGSAGALSTGGYVDMNTSNGTSAVDIPSISGTSSITVTVDGINTAVSLTGNESFDQIAAKLSEVEGITATVVAGTTAGEFRLAIAASDDVRAFSIAGSPPGLGIEGNSDVAASTNTQNAIRENFQKEYNELLKQINDLTKDAGFNGNNLLDSRDLKVIFSEDGSSSLKIKGVDITATGLGLTQITGDSFQYNGEVDNTLTDLKNALANLRSQASTFGSNLSVVQTRQDFTKNMMSTLETGAANLVLADINEEGANMLALQTRQQLSTTALSMASQADQSVLSLFR